MKDKTQTIIDDLNKSYQNIRLCKICGEPLLSDEDEICEVCMEEMEEDE